MNNSTYRKPIGTFQDVKDKNNTLIVKLPAKVANLSQDILDGIQNRILEGNPTKYIVENVTSRLMRGSTSQYYDVVDYLWA